MVGQLAQDGGNIMTQMTFDQNLIDEVEKLNTNSSPTRNRQFDHQGYLILRNFCDVTEYVENAPRERGKISYRQDEFHFDHVAEEPQVNGSLARYGHPKFKQLHTDIRLKIENIIGRKLFNTYYYDRFYFVGQELPNHLDRDACEISVSLHISSNPAKIEWPFWIKDVQENHVSVVLNPGDMVIYKGCERPHWRHPLKSAYSKKELFFRNLKKLKDDTWYHQIFFHYVLADGIRLQHAGDIGINHEN